MTNKISRRFNKLSMLDAISRKRGCLRYRSMNGLLNLGAMLCCYFFLFRLLFVNSWMNSLYVVSQVRCVPRITNRLTTQTANNLLLIQHSAVFISGKAKVLPYFTLGFRIRHKLVLQARTRTRHFFVYTS